MNYNTKIVVAIGTTKVKKTARSFRIWIEGNKLLEAGFEPNVPFSVDFDIATEAHPSRIFLKLDADGDRRVTKASRNGKARPIIDLHQALVGELFNEGDELEVFYTNAGYIMITEVRS